MKAKDRPAAKTLAGVLLAGLFSGGCGDGRGPITDVDGRRPELTQGTLHVTWEIARLTNEPVTCSTVSAQSVLVTIGSGRRRTFRMPCDLAAREAWIPLTPGPVIARAELVGPGDAVLSKTSDLQIDTRTADGQQRLPLSFVVR